LTNNLQALTINLQEQIDTLANYFEDPDTFDIGSIQYIQRDSERCREHAIKLLGDLHKWLLSERARNLKMPQQDDRAKLPSQHQSPPVAAAVERPISEISPLHTLNPRSFAGRAASAEPAPTNRISIPSHYDINIRKGTNISAGTPPDSYKDAQRFSAPRAEAPNRSVSDSEVELINSTEVMRHAESIENFLARRKMSRATFYNDTDRPLSTNSTANSAATTSPPPSFAHPSSRLTYTDDMVASPIQTSRPNSTLLMMRSQSQEGQTTLSPDRQLSSGSDMLIFGLPDTPPMSSGRQSATDGLSLGLATTLKLPGFGVGVDDEKQVVGQGSSSDPGPMLISEIHGHNQPTPTTSVQSIDWPISHDTSFYKYGGFCKGATMLLHGDKSALKVIKKPGV
jgi:hypothetical protein